MKDNTGNTARHASKKSGAKAARRRAAQRATAGIRASRKVRAQQVDGFQTRTRVQIIDPTEVAATFERTPEDYEVVGGAVEQAATKTCSVCGRQGHRGFTRQASGNYTCTSASACAKRAFK